MCATTVLPGQLIACKFCYCFSQSWGSLDLLWNGDNNSDSFVALRTCFIGWKFFEIIHCKHWGKSPAHSNSASWAAQCKFCYCFSQSWGSLDLLWNGDNNSDSFVALRTCFIGWKFLEILHCKHWGKSPAHSNSASWAALLRFSQNTCSLQQCFFFFCGSQDLLYRMALSDRIGFFCGLARLG